MARLRSAVAHFGQWLGGSEHVSGRGLPVEEFAHPYPLLAMLLLGVNDHVLKGSGWLPGWLTGKLSDVAGLFFFPLFLTAAADTLGFAIFHLLGGRGPDYSLRRSKLLVAVAVTAGIFVPLQLSTTWAARYVEFLGLLDVLGLFGHFSVVPDPSDLLALPVLALAYWHGSQAVQRVPIGRLQVLRARIHRAPSAAQLLTHRSLRDIARRIPARGPVHRRWHHLLDLLPRALSPNASTELQAEAQRALVAYRAALSGESAGGKAP